MKQTEIVALALVRYASSGRYSAGEEEEPAESGTAAPRAPAAAAGSDPQASVLAQSRTVSSAPPEASKAPVPPLYDNDQTGPRCPVSVATLRADPRSHICIEPSSVPQAI